MGINDLWEVLEPAAAIVPLISLAIEGRYEGPAPHVPYVVGVDARRAKILPSEHFYFGLARLVRLPVQLIFAFDGNQRPQIKRGHRVSTNDHWMVKPTQRLLNAFNVQWITAAGEAEAQLAQMNGAGVIDAVMTDDSDAFVFGAHTVLRNLTGDGFLTLAICCGGDYDKKGLVGCGRETALGLARCVDAGVLRTAMCGNSLDGPLQRWRDAARYHLVDDPTGKMGRSHPALAHSLPDSFPDPHVIDLYARPAVTAIAKLPILQSPLLGWESKKVVSTFRSTIWPVVDLANNSPASDEIALAPACTRAVFQSHAVRPKKALAGVPGHNNDVPTHDLEQSTLQLLEDSPGCSHCEDRAPRSHRYIRVWLADKIYDSWVQTMILQSPNHPSTSNATHSSVIDLTHDDEAVAVSDVIDLTQDGDDVVPWSAGASHDFIDLTL
ncbi:PIN domain-like protein [Suillus clintonianus]|uniref:PIN domain-like protein n=1 Tax=Suillus clintonianus TaxID=1904413 RepID=UPI001B884F11|nr:PIN domain-like protein [Suillus clintonianus]KAG2138983.1 PIN domain-like protein [Suillus clintonianus]